MSSVYNVIGVEGFGEGVSKLNCHTGFFPTAGKHQAALDRYDCGFGFINLNFFFTIELCTSLLFLDCRRVTS